MIYLAFIPLITAWVGLCHIMRRNNEVIRKPRYVIEFKIKVDIAPFIRAMEDLATALRKVQLAMIAAKPHLIEMTDAVKKLEQ